MFPATHTMGTDFKPAQRKGTDEIIHRNEW